MKKAIATALIACVIPFGHFSVRAVDSTTPSAKYADPTEQLDAEIEMTMSYFKDLTTCVNKIKPGQKEPFARFQERMRLERPNFITARKIDFGGDHMRALAAWRDVLLSSLNDDAARLAAKFGLVPPAPVTVDALRAAINDETMRVVPICSGPTTVMASASYKPSAEDIDREKRLNAELDMALVYAKEMMRCINKLDSNLSRPGDFRRVEKTVREGLSADREERAAANGDRASAIAHARDGLIAVINQFAESVATNLHLGAPVVVTTQSLQAAILDEKARVVPICSGTEPLHGRVAEGRYSSHRNWFSVPIPTPSNQPKAPFSVRDESVDSPDPNYELVRFLVQDFGELFVAGVDRFSDEFIETKIKRDDPRTALSKLANLALHNIGRQFPTMPTLLEDQYLDTAYGEGLVRLYMAPKGSILAEIKGDGGQPAVADTFDVVIGVMVARQKNDFIYAIAEDDGEDGAAEGTKNALKQKTQSFFESIALNR
jgi:hypothetical protein